MTIANDGSTPLVAPVAVRQVDVEAGVDDLRLGASRSGRPYRSLLAIARGRNGPLATASFEVPAGGVLPRDLLIAGLRQRVKAVGEPWPDVVTAADAPGAARQDVRAPAVSVVIATCRNPSALERCVGSILGSDYDNFDVIVVENAPGSSASQQMLASRFPDDPRIRYVEEPRRGASWARNSGLAHAGGEIIAFTDDDVVVDRQWLRAGVDALTSAPDVGCATGLIVPLELESSSQLLLEQFASFGKGFRRHTYRLADARRRDPLFPYTAGSIGSGASTVMWARIARELGGFDAVLGPGTPTRGAEDLDLFIRVLRTGHAVVYEPGAIVWHEHPAGMARLRRQVYHYGVGLGAMLAKQLIAGPERGYLLRAVPRGVRYLRDPSSRKNASKPRDYPRHLDFLERLGMLVGPAAYLWSALLHLHR